MADWLNVFLVAVCGIPVLYCLFYSLMVLLDRATYTVLNAGREEEE